MIGRLTIVKLSIVPKVIYRFKIQMNFFSESEKSILKFIWVSRDPEELK